jgi:DNA-directed RNA polymerase subunit RPC12/RpoP
MKDKGTCPHCQEEFETEEYGYGLRCPHCDGKIDVLPKADHWVHTPWGVFGFSGEWEGIAWLALKLAGLWTKKKSNTQGC